jgi:hypothetical protein
MNLSSTSYSYLPKVEQQNTSTGQSEVNSIQLQLTQDYRSLPLTYPSLIIGTSVLKRPR